MASNNDENGMSSEQKDEFTKVSKLFKVRNHNACDICGKTFNSKKLLTERFGSDHQNYLAAQKKIQVQKDSHKVKNTQTS